MSRTTKRLRAASAIPASSLDRSTARARDVAVHTLLNATDAQCRIACKAFVQLVVEHGLHVDLDAIAAASGALRRPPWVQLPAALIDCILECLSPRDILLTAERVCSAWLLASTERGAGWRRVVIDDHPCQRKKRYVAAPTDDFAVRSIVLLPALAYRGRGGACRLRRTHTVHIHVDGDMDGLRRTVSLLPSTLRDLAMDVRSSAGSMSSGVFEPLSALTELRRAKIHLHDGHFEGRWASPFASTVTSLDLFVGRASHGPVSFAWSWPSSLVELALTGHFIPVPRVVSLPRLALLRLSHPFAAQAFMDAASPTSLRSLQLGMMPGAWYHTVARFTALTRLQCRVMFHAGRDLSPIDAVASAAASAEVQHLSRLTRLRQLDLYDSGTDALEPLLTLLPRLSVLESLALSGHRCCTALVQRLVAALPQSPTFVSLDLRYCRPIRGRYGSPWHAHWTDMRKLRTQLAKECYSADDSRPALAANGAIDLTVVD